MNDKMKAIALTVHTTHLNLVDRPEPSITAPDEVKVRVLRVGICGTDREETSGGRALAPGNGKELVIGHEMLGQVVQVGDQVSRVKPGDYTVFTVRRGCGRCLPCAMNRSDMCRTGDYRERGIWGLDGYQAEYVVDKEQYLVCVPPELEPIGVLTEPTSVVEKAIDEAVRLQATRLPDAQATPDWLYGRRCLVAGLGPIGLLGAMALRLRGAEVYGLDIVDEKTPRPQWLEGIGGHYVDGRKIPADQVRKMLGPMDLILEAAGIAMLDLNLLDTLEPDGIIVVTGIPSADRPIQVDGAEIIRGLVLNNQSMVGSVNSARDHFQMAVNDLSNARLAWGDHLTKLITNRYPYSNFGSAMTQHGPDEIKVVVEWAGDSGD
jgi:threonine dehydrogenase-like Zn-dependent dehydrogenase